MTLDLARELTIGNLLTRRARMTPYMEAVVFEERRLNCSELNEQVNRLAHGLIACSIHPGDHVSLLFENCLEMVISIFAAAKVGAVVVPINYRLVPREMEYQIDHSDSILHIFDAKFEAHMIAAYPNLPKVKTWISTGITDIPGCLSLAELSLNNSSEPSILVKDETPGLILYTSGTTGRPKGAVMTHKALMVQTMALAIDVPAPKPCRSLLIYPLFHSGGVMSFFWDLFLGSVIMMNKITIPEMLRLIEAEKITSTSMVPDIWNQIVNYPERHNYDLSSLQVACTGAAPTPRLLKQKVVDVFPNVTGMWEAFGMTETCATGVMGTPADNFTKTEAMGRPLSTWEMSVIDTQDKELSSPLVGEAVYRGPGVMKEYYKNPEATAEAFKNDWFHSGDLVWVDEDGYFYFAGRLKDMIISGGENIYPAEVEELIYKHPKVLETTVIGLPDPDWGERVVAFVVAKPGESLTQEEVIQWCKQGLAGYKKPKEVRFLEALPKGPTNKILKYVLKEQCIKEAGHA